MSGEIDTLAQFFGFDADGETRAKARIEQIGANGKSAIGSALQMAPKPMRDYALGSITECLRGALATPMKEVFAHAWTTRQDLKRYLDRSLYPPDAVCDYDLKENTISYSYKPSMQLELNGKPIGGPIHFDINVKLISAPLLKIKDARVIGARAGTIQGAGTISCESMPLIERKSAPFSLRGDIAFNPGFIIGQPYESAPARA